VGGVRKLRLMANADAEYRTQNAEHRYGYGAKDMQIRAGRQLHLPRHIILIICLRKTNKLAGGTCLVLFLDRR